MTRIIFDTGEIIDCEHVVKIVVDDVDDTVLEFKHDEHYNSVRVCDLDITYDNITREELCEGCIFSDMPRDCHDCLVCLGVEEDVRESNSGN